MRIAFKPAFIMVIVGRAVRWQKRFSCIEVFKNNNLMLT